MQNSEDFRFEKPSELFVGGNPANFLCCTSLAIAYCLAVYRAEHYRFEFLWKCEYYTVGVRNKVTHKYIFKDIIDEIDTSWHHLATVPLPHPTISAISVHERTSG